MDETTERRETHDFMNVESFSQLPFIRPAPVKEKGGGAIRLFGIEFGGGDPRQFEEESNPSESINNSKNSHSNNEEGAANHKDNSDSNNNKRRFECHYCFRNFPTSQALGGHQNAHKRERQHAKRGAHLQADAHVYGFPDHHHRQLGPSASYPSWNSGGDMAGDRFYSGHSSYYYSRATPTSSTTIHGSPLGFWRVPAAMPVQGVYATTAFNPDRSSNSALPLFAGEHETEGTLVGGGSSTQSRYWYSSKANVQDHVSLDLHL